MDAHTNSGLCPPTRYGLLIGRYITKGRGTPSIPKRMTEESQEVSSISNPS
jgi:hypothetical protein